MVWQGFGERVGGGGDEVGVGWGVLGVDGWVVGWSWGIGREGGFFVLF